MIASKEEPFEANHQLVSGYVAIQVCFVQLWEELGVLSHTHWHVVEKKRKKKTFTPPHEVTFFVLSRIFIKMCDASAHLV